jgi:proline iminopeptidase
MRFPLTTGNVASIVLMSAMLASVAASRPEQKPTPREARVPVKGASLYSREIGRGTSVIVLHGGPDFDQGYLIPDLDQLADSFHLIYYDQRGRGRSADGVHPEEVTLGSEMEDLDSVRKHFGLRSGALLGHSWGTVLALEYAVRQPTRVSHLILMNPAPASAADFAAFRQAYLATLGADMDRQRAIVGSDAYQAADPEAVVDRYRIHFRPAFARSEDYERLMAAMKAGFFSQGSKGILEARAIEDRLMKETWEVPGYDLMPRLASLNIPTLVVWGDHDFVPVEIATHIAQSIPHGEMVTLTGCGHFAYLECASDVRRVVKEFFSRRP